MRERQRLVSFRRFSGNPASPPHPFGGSPPSPKHPKTLAWNERASQYAITLRFTPRNAAFARKDPLKRVYTGHGNEFRLSADHGFDPLPPRAAFVVTGSFSQSVAHSVRPTT